jgi:hypothetical protein
MSRSIRLSVVLFVVVAALSLTSSRSGAQVLPPGLGGGTCAEPAGLPDVPQLGVRPALSSFEFGFSRYVSALRFSWGYVTVTRPGSGVSATALRERRGLHRLIP